MSYLSFILRHLDVCTLFSANAIRLAGTGWASKRENVRAVNRHGLPGADNKMEFTSRIVGLGLNYFHPVLLALLALRRSFCRAQ